MTKLIFFCGKMAAGKSTLAKRLAERENAILLVQDELSETLFPGLVVNVATYLEYAGRINRMVAPQVAAILLKGNQTRYTTFNEAIAKEAKRFEGTDHAVRLAFTTTQKEGRTFYNAVGIVLNETETSSTAAPATSPATGLPLEREPGAEG